MTRILVVAVAVAVAAFVACGGGGSTPQMDAPKLTNQAFGSACTVVSDTSTECASGVCTDSINMGSGYVCSQKCTMLMGSDPSCPQGSMGQKCNAKGYCRP